MGEWKEYKLGDLAKVKGGKRLPLGKNLTEQPTNHPYIRTRDINNNKITISDLLYVPEDVFNSISRYIVEKDDVIISIVGTIGLCAIVPSELHFASLTENCAKIVDINKSKLNSKFLFYFFISDIGQEEIGKRNVGSTQPKLPLYNINDIPIPTPPLSEQQTIASILSSLDDKIDLLHRQNKTLEQLAETLFRQWFVEEADESWEEKILEELIQFNPTEKINRANEYTFYNMRCLSDNSMCINKGGKRIASSATSFRNDDVLLAKITPCLENGKTGFVMHLQENEIARGSTEFIVMRSKSRVNAYYIYCLSRSSEFRDSAILSMSGTSGRQRVQIDLLKNYAIYYNEIKIEEFGKIVKPYFEKIKINQIQIRTLTQLRDTLLPKLMSGEVRLKI